MDIGDGEFEVRMRLLGQLNMTMVMDQARIDPEFLDKLISSLEARPAELLAEDEPSLLEWASAKRNLRR